MPRPTRLSAALQERVCAYVNAGAPVPHACEAAGLPWPTCKEWLRKGKAGKKPYAEFAEAITQAKAKWVAGSVLNISKAATKDWRAAAWLLERRQEEFRPPPHQTELTGRNGGPLEVMTSAKVTLGAKLDEIAKRFGDEPSGASGGESD